MDTNNVNDIFSVKVQSNDFTMLPKLIMIDRRLSVHDKLVYNSLMFFSGYKNIFPRIELLCKITDFNRGTVIASLSKLEKLGWIRKEKRKGYSNIYHIYQTNFSHDEWIKCIQYIEDEELLNLFSESMRISIEQKAPTRKSKNTENPVEGSMVTPYRGSMVKPHGGSTVAPYEGSMVTPYTNNKELNINKRNRVSEKEIPLAISNNTREPNKFDTEHQTEENSTHTQETVQPINVKPNTLTTHEEEVRSIIEQEYFGMTGYTLSGEVAQIRTIASYCLGNITTLKDKLGVLKKRRKERRKFWCSVAPTPSNLVKYWNELFEETVTPQAKNRFEQDPDMYNEQKIQEGILRAQEKGWIKTA
jgi:DNA-binding PadR family transcriptional regulator